MIIKSKANNSNINTMPKKSANFYSSDLLKLIEGGATKSGVSISEKTALQTSAALCAARVLAEGVAQLPIKIYRDTLKGGQVHREEARDHPLWHLLRDRPNPWMTSFEFREWMMYHAIFTGNAFALINCGAASGDVVELLPLISGNVRIVTDGWNPAYDVFDRHGKIGRYSHDKILHFRGPSWDGYRGLNVVQLAKEALGLSDALQASQAQLQANGGRPSGLLTTESPLSPDARERLRSSWDEKFGPNGAGGIAVLDGGWNFVSTTMNAVDSQHIENRRFQIEEIARYFRVFPQMLMQSDKASTYASAEQFFIAHVTHSLDPWLCRFEQVFARDLLSFDIKNITIEFIRDGMLRGAIKDRADYNSKALGAGSAPAWMTPNEVRRTSNLNPVDGGDALPLPSAMAGGE